MRDLLLSFKATAILQFLNLGTGVLVARLLLPEGRGELALVMLWPLLLLAIASLSIDQAVSFNASRARDRSGRIVASAFLLAGGLGLASIPPGLLALEFAYRGERAALHELAVAYFLLLALVNAAGAAAASGLVALGKVGTWNLLRVLQPTLYLAALLLLALLDAVAVRTVLATNLAAALLCGLLAIALVWRAATPPRRPDRQALVAVAGYAAKVHLGSLAEIVGSRLDQIVIAALLAPRDLGLYVVAATLAGALGLISQTLVPLAFPRAAAQREQAGRLQVLGRYLRLATALAAGGAVAVVLLAPWLLSLLFGEAYAVAADVTRILALATCLRVVRGLLAHGIKALGRPGLVSRLTWFALPVSLLSVAGLASLYGLLGAAAGVVAGEAAAVALLLLALKRERLGSPLALMTPSRDDWHYLRARLGRRPGDAGRPA
ncbi:MAG: oligosaccharide flippase family protein [Tistlia sp.]|uniref:lipopolysaccharide biosynthesis protein n=1 Tax=Tistlia sp. TaxID=3057121 RepID=UPI0034A54350